MKEILSNNKIIAKNTFVLYIRLFFVMIVGLYTSRVVLATLGVEDYGVYGVVGGVVALMGFLNASLSGATSRFITFELGKNDRERLLKVFSSAIVVHGIMALVFIFLAETLGLYIFYNTLVIPQDRINAAFWVFQLSTLSAVISILQIPYSASIIAHERMNIYAYIEIGNTFLKLIVVYLITIGNLDKLILYSLLLFLVSIIIIFIYGLYCLKEFEETHFTFVIEKRILIPLLSFSGWNIYGNLGGGIALQGTNFVINIFFGVIMNASVNVAATITNVVSAFALNAMTAFRPPITKMYAVKKIEQMEDMTILAMKSILTLFAIIAVPVFIECDYILKIWLVSVPDYSSLFCRIILISIMIETMRHIVMIDINSIGKVKIANLISGSFFTIVPLFVYLLFKLGKSVEYAYYVFILTNFLLLLIDIILLKKYILNINLTRFIKIIFRIITVFCLSIIILQLLKLIFIESMSRFIVVSLSSICIVSFLSLLFIFNGKEKKEIYKLIRKPFIK